MNNELLSPNHFRVEFICGTTVDGGGGLIPPHVAREIVAQTEAEFLLLFRGYSKSTVSGGWVSPETGRKSMDESVVFTVIIGLGVSKRTLDEIQDWLKDLFRQESVPYIVTPVFSQF